MKKAIVIPSYKAEKTLPGVIESLPDELFQGGGIAVIVHDCSPDRTGEVADGLARENKGVYAVHHEENKGYGGALKTGMTFALEKGAEICAIVHADGQYAPSMALELCSPIEEGETEIVQGSRMKGGARQGENPMPLSRYIPNRVLTTMENFVVGTKMEEFHSGYMVYSKKLLERVPFRDLQDNYNFDAEMIILAHLVGIKTAEVGIPTKYDDETSSLNPIPYGLNCLKMMARVIGGHYQVLIHEHEKHHPELVANEVEVEDPGEKEEE